MCLFAVTFYLIDTPESTGNPWFSVAPYDGRVTLARAFDYKTDLHKLALFINVTDDNSAGNPPGPGISITIVLNVTVRIRCLVLPFTLGSSRFVMLRKVIVP